MTARVPQKAAPAVTKIRQQFAWLPSVLRFAAIPVVAWLWWALAFLPWMRAGLGVSSASWPPTLPTLFRDLAVVVFGSLGASVVVVTLVRKAGLAFLSVLLGFGVSAWVTLTHPAEAKVFALTLTERQLMLVLCGVAALIGLALGAAAIRSQQGFGFLGLLAVFPVVSLATTVLFGLDADARWLTRGALAVLLVAIAWRHWTGVLVWPIFFMLFWLLNLARAAVAYGAGGVPRSAGRLSFGAVTDATVNLLRSDWTKQLGVSWQLFWPGAIVAAVVVAGLLVWRRARQVRRAHKLSGQGPAMAGL